MIEKAIQAQMLTDGDRVVIYDAARLPPPVAAWFDANIPAELREAGGGSYAA